MSVFKNGRLYHYEFKLDGRRRRGSTGTANKQQAIAEERRQRERLEKSYSQIIEEEAREQQRKTIQLAANEFLQDYMAKHQAPTFAEYALGHVSRLLGGSLVVEITPNVVKRYQADRLHEKAGPKTINDEVQLLLRLRPLLSSLYEWPMFLMGYACAIYQRAVQEQGYGHERNPGHLDLWSATYLPICDVFVTRDKRQRRALKILNKANPRTTRILSYERWRESLLGASL